jgi:nitroreductase
MLTLLFIMDFFETIKKRRSIRAFQEREIEEEKSTSFLEAANAAPSAGDLQAYEIYLVRSEAKRRELSNAALEQFFIAEAPLVLVFCASPRRSAIKYGGRGTALYCLQDATIACAYAQLAVTALGLGSVWVGAFDEDKVLEIIGAPNSLIPIAILCIGYPAESPPPTPRRMIENLVHEVL